MAIPEDDGDDSRRPPPTDRTDERIEGDVIEVRANQDLPVVVIANREGLVEVVLLGEAKAVVCKIEPGDYLGAGGSRSTRGCSTPMRSRSSGGS